MNYLKLLQLQFVLLDYNLFEVVAMALLYPLLGAVIQKNNISFRRRGKEETLDCYTIKSEMKLEMVALFDMRIYCPRL